MRGWQPFAATEIGRRGPRSSSSACARLPTTAFVSRRRFNALVGRDRNRIITHDRSTVAAIRLLDCLPSNPIVTVSKASEVLGLTAPPTRKAIELLQRLGVLREITGNRRDRAYAYHEYMQILNGDEA